MKIKKRKRVRLLHGDCLGILPTLAAGSIDAIVTDPPYELGFMGKSWDKTGIAYQVEVWRECLRVLKPGGHLLAFGGSRTYHRLATAVEDAGFEIRDQIMWVYGSGFPKSMDVSKALDKVAGAKREVVGVRKGAGMSAAKPQGAGTFRDDVWVPQGPDLPLTTPATPAAQQWQGWGTALKPAHEPIVVARKPLIGTVAENVLAHGTGGINVDGCRVGTDENLNGGAYAKTRQESSSEWAASGSLHKTTGLDFQQPSGRFPANLIHDGSEEVLAGFPSSKSPKPYKYAGKKEDDAVIYGKGIGRGFHDAEYGDSGSAARFFYCAKANKKDRGEGNKHPTVKPTALMRYLCRLITPPGGAVLDPFMGSGSTGKAALLEGFRFVGIEKEKEYVELSKNRIQVR